MRILIESNGKLFEIYPKEGFCEMISVFINRRRCGNPAKYQINDKSICSACLAKKKMKNLILGTGTINDEEIPL